MVAHDAAEDDDGAVGGRGDEALDLLGVELVRRDPRVNPRFSHGRGTRRFIDSLSNGCDPPLTLNEMRALLLVGLCLLQPVSPKLAFASEGGFGQTGTTLSGRITQTEERPAAVRRAGRDRRAAPGSARRRRRQLSVRQRAAGAVSRRRPRGRLQHAPNRSHGRHHAGDAQHLDRFRSALRRSAVGQPHGAAAVRVVPADDGARRPGADEESRSDDRRDVVGSARRGDA